MSRSDSDRGIHLESDVAGGARGKVRHKFAIAGLHCATLELVRDQPGPLLA